MCHAAINENYNKMIKIMKTALFLPSSGGAGNGSTFLGGECAEQESNRKAVSTKQSQNTVQSHADKITCIYHITQQTGDVELMLVKCWANVADAGPTCKQHWFNIVFLGSIVQ